METIQSNLQFAEGLRWHEGRLWLSDLFSRQVYTATPDGKLEEQVFVPGQPSGLGFLPDGTPLVVSMMDRKLLRIDPDGLREVASLAPLATGPCNDMTVDNEGNAYVGCFDQEIWYQAAVPSRDDGRIFRVSIDGQVNLVATGLGVPNGMAFIDRGRRLVVAETRWSRLTVFDVNSDGSLANRRLFAQLDEEVMADGICADREGAIWVSGLFGEIFVRVREGGEILGSIPTPGREAITCALGGDDGRRLYCITGQRDNPEDFRHGRMRSAIEYTDVEVPV